MIEVAFKKLRILRRGSFGRLSNEDVTGPTWPKSARAGSEASGVRGGMIRCKMLDSRGGNGAEWDRTWRFSTGGDDSSKD